MKYNEEHGITPHQIAKSKGSALMNRQQGESAAYVEPDSFSIASDVNTEYKSRKDIEKAVASMKKKMAEAAKKLEFLEAAQYRDELIKLEAKLGEYK